MFSLLLCLLIGASHALQLFTDAGEHDERVAVRVEPGVDVKRLAADLGYELHATVCDIPHHYVWQRKPKLVRKRTDTSELLEAHPHVHWHQYQMRRSYKRRALQIETLHHYEPLQAVRDPQFMNQWHLDDRQLIHVNVSLAWRRGFTGLGVTVAIVDDGLQFVHPDIAANFNELGSYDFNDFDIDVTPNPLFHDGDHDDHGTPAGGLCCAVVNGEAVTPAHASYCGVGVAPRAAVSGLRILGRMTEDYQNAGALCFQNQVVDIYSNSWGPPDNGRYVEGPDTLAKLAMESSIRDGRGGRGTLYVWAGGNGRPSGDSCNFDGWANWRYTITVASVTQRGTQPYYSEECPALIVSSPSSGNGAAMTTTDLLGTWGKSNKDCLPSFGGTSAAAPIAAGAVAVVLESNPDLGWRDMQAVLIESAAWQPLINQKPWVKNGAGLLYSHKFGFGVINVVGAIEIATRNYTMLPTLARMSNSSALSVDKAFTQAAPLAVTYAFGGASADDIVEHVEVYVTIQHPHRGQVGIKLISPSGMVSTFAEYHADRASNFPPGWRFSSVAHWGEKLGGTWRLELTSQTGGGTLKSWAIAAYSHIARDYELQRLAAHEATLKAAAATSTVTPKV